MLLLENKKMYTEMKKQITYNILFLGILAGTFQSCADDFLSLEPKTNKLEANAYKTEEDAFNAMIAVYDGLVVQPWNFVPIQSDIFSDDTYCGGEPGGGMWQWQDQEIGIIDAENGASSDLWNRCYSGIYRANMFLEKEGGFDWKSENKRKRMHAEVIVLRAYQHWDLVRHFGWVPIISELLPSSEDYKSKPQNTPEEVFNFVASELVSALPDLPETVPANETGRITKDVVRVLLARVYMLYEGFGKQVLGATGNLDANGTEITKQYILDGLQAIITSNRYHLLDNYADVFAWDNENNAESIFEWQYSEKSFSGDWGNIWGVDGNFSVIFVGPRNPQPDTTYTAGWSFSVLTWSLVDEFEPEDVVRKEVTVFNADEELNSYTKSFQNTGFFNHKYMPRRAFYPLTGSQELNWPKNYIDMRYADVLLMAAELLLDQNQAQALVYFNQVRTRAMGDAAALSTLTLDDIYHERRVEFACEGHRKWDLLRRSLDYAKQKIDASWDIPANLPNADDFGGREFNKDTWGMLPIPGSEIRLANEGVLKQNVPAFK
jgi:hypothetical protein